MEIKLQEMLKQYKMDKEKFYQTFYCTTVPQSCPYKSFGNLNKNPSDGTV